MTAPNLLSHTDVLPIVSEALRDGRPVVALESTIITHGMPYPENDAMCAAVEQVITEGGAVPAVIAVMDGRVKVGLDAADRARLAQMKNLRKLSRADLAFAVSQGISGGTTVAATMIVAERMGIQVFATGGIGGVHRGAESTFDISADLPELGRTNVIVVAAGAKAILDIPKTLEYLETLGVPVVGYGTDMVPAFWSRSSGFAAPIRLDTAAAIAKFQKVRQDMGIAGGMLVANPIPAADEIPNTVIDDYIAEAQAELQRKTITGKGVTPFLLGKIVSLSGGASLKSNIALVVNNAKLAAEIAKALS
jgi:pseudouridine-5'-phosphate glycosidase